MTYHQRTAEMKRVDQRRQGVGLSTQTRRGARHPHRIARTRPIHRHHPIVLGEFIDDAVGEVAELAGEPVHQKNSRSLPLFHDMQAAAGRSKKRPSGGSVASTWRAVRAVKSISEPAMAAMAATTRRNIIITSGEYALPLRRP